MATDTCIGIDIGTSSVKAAGYALDGSLVTESSRRLSLNYAGPAVEQDLDEFWTATTTALREITAGLDPAHVAGVAVSGQMAGIGVVDAAAEPLGPYDSWLDTRCAAELATLTAGDLARIEQLSSSGPTLDIGARMLRASRQGLPSGAKFVTAGGYVAGRLCALPAVEAFIDRTYLHFADIADVSAGRWDEEFASELGIDPAQLPRIRGCTEQIGVVTSEVATASGLLAGTPVLVGCGDTAAAMVGAGGNTVGRAVDIAGTAAIFGVCVDAPRPGTGLLSMRSPLNDTWTALGYVSGAGQVVEWLIEGILGLTGAAAYDRLDLALSESEGAEPPVFLPHFGGMPTPYAPNMRGAIWGLGRSTTVNALIRAALAGIAFEYRGFWEAIEAEGGGCLSEVHGVGGGTRSAGWNQLKADILGVPYRPQAVIDAGSRGLAGLVAAGVGSDPTPFTEPRNAQEFQPLKSQEGYPDYRRFKDVVVSALGGRDQ